ncbi:putative membrane-associated oxidoreductase [Roseibium sp. TrichSKD4]|uniref:hypothetical protein n=1 Tax=Roseibium sp. TrichSKD4 TaxID=744980 RepID=UPI0001E56A19|nr:hypothetical protein [Roseibium sp. TrichSKD4]EFO31103.1 putative membrane-associated oxidoreductase [Roseibium sp. TrichSKD4]
MLITSYAQIEELIENGELTNAEQKLLEGCKNGRLVVVGDGQLPNKRTEENAVRAGLLRYLMCGGCETYRPHDHGVELVGAWVEGELDIEFAKTRGNNHLVACSFHEVINAFQMVGDAINLTRSRFPGLFAQGAKIAGGVFLREAVSESRVSFSGAKIAEDVFLSDTTSEGTVSFAGAEIGGQFSCNKTKLKGDDGKALNAQGAKITGDVFLHEATSEGEVSLAGAEIGGQLSCNKAKLKGGDHKALNAQSAKIAQGVFLTNTISKGEISLAGAEIGGQLSCHEAKLKGGNHKAPNAQGAKIASDVFLTDAISEGEVSFAGAEIDGRLACENAILAGNTGDALNAQRLVVKAGFFWREVDSVSGLIDLASAHVGDLVDDKESWDKVEQLELSGFTYDTLHGSTDLAFRKDWLKKGARPNGAFHPQPYQQYAKVLRTSGHRAEARDILVEKEIQQRRARRSVWRNSIRFMRSLNNLIQQKGRDAETRRAAAQTAAAAAAEAPEIRAKFNDVFFRRFGSNPTRSDCDAFENRWAQQDFQNQLLIDRSWNALCISWNTIWDRVLRFVAGYGYKPWRSLGWLFAMIMIVAGLAHLTWQAGDFAPNSDVILTSENWKSYADAVNEDGAPTYANPAEVRSKTPDQQAVGHGRDYETFDSIFYAMDVVVPIIDLGQTDAWAPSTSRGQTGFWMFYLQKVFIILGWVITAIAAAAITGIIRNNDEV